MAKRKNKIEIDLGTIEPPELRQFVLDEIQKSEDLGVQVKLLNIDSIDMDDVDCGGFFSDSKSPCPQLVVCVDKPTDEWVQIFIHETCHRDQWSEEDPIWDFCIQDKYNSGDVLNMWLDDVVELDKQQLKDVIQAVVDLELDCERRALAKIKEYNLPIDTDLYAQRANAYVWYHWVVAHQRSWGTVTVPYENPKIWSKMPAHFDNDYTKIKKKMLNRFIKQCY